MFGGQGAAERAHRHAARKSVLDFIREDSKSLTAEVGYGDKQKLDGRHARLGGETPVANLWTSMLERMDVRVPFVGDSTGALRAIG